MIDRMLAHVVPMPLGFDLGPSDAALELEQRLDLDKIANHYEHRS
jgi:hypothetical protein